MAAAAVAAAAVIITIRSPAFTSSNGPEVKIRGTAHHVAEKYLQLARDAQASGDPVTAENHFQHAEHYLRMIAAAQEQFRQQNPVLPGAASTGRDSRRGLRRRRGRCRPDGPGSASTRSAGSGTTNTGPTTAGSAPVRQSAELQQQPAAFLSAAGAAAAVWRSSRRIRIIRAGRSTNRSSINPTTRRSISSHRRSRPPPTSSGLPSFITGAQPQRERARHCFKRSRQQPGWRPLSASPSPASSRTRRAAARTCRIRRRNSAATTAPSAGNS